MSGNKRTRLPVVSEKYSDSENDEYFSSSESTFTTDVFPANDQAPLEVNRDNCYLCVHYFGQPTVPGQDPVNEKMWSACCNNRDLPAKQIAKLISDIFFQETLEPILKAGGELDANLVVLDEKTAYTHLTEHMLDPLFQVKEEISNLHDIRKQLGKRIYNDDGECDYRKVRLRLDVHKCIMSSLVMAKKFM